MSAARFKLRWWHPVLATLVHVGLACLGKWGFLIGCLAWVCAATAVLLLRRSDS